MTMELQLGLALPNNFSEGFDLNSHGSEPLSYVGSCLASTESAIIEYNSKKRSVDEAFVPQTLALLVWNDQPNEEDDGHSELDKNTSTISKSDGDEDGVVGWPPIKPLRRKLCHQSGGAGGRNFDDGGPRGSKPTYVKVKMEGVAIARKVDLSLHHSYQSLRDTLDGMFGRGLKTVKPAYKLTYQDREGDWLLAGDLPWSCFTQSVQRLNLQRSTN